MINNESHSDELTKLNDAAISQTDAKAKRLDQAVWVMWWSGTILIVMSWVGIVSPTIGWIGFSAALASSFVSVIAKRYWKFPK